MLECENEKCHADNNMENLESDPYVVVSSRSVLYYMAKNA